MVLLRRLVLGVVFDEVGLIGFGERTTQRLERLNVVVRPIGVRMCGHDLPVA